MCASPLLRLGPARVCTGRGKACTYSDPLGSAYGCASLLLRLGPARVCTGRGHASTRACLGSCAGCATPLLRLGPARVCTGTGHSSTRTCSGPRRSVHVFSFDSGPLWSVRGGTMLRRGLARVRVRRVEIFSFRLGPFGICTGRGGLFFLFILLKTNRIIDFFCVYIMENKQNYRFSFYISKCCFHDDWI